jgi:hypothetical protein
MLTHANFCAVLNADFALLSNWQYLFASFQISRPVFDDSGFP